MNNKLYSKDKKGKVRVVDLSLLLVNGVYVIKTFTGQLGGKMTERPDDVITKGKVKRTLEEQAVLQYNSKLTKYKDRGNKTLEDLGFVSGDINDFLQKHLPDVKTDQNGLKKCMKALSYKEVTEEFINSKTWLISSKLDGKTYLCRL